MPASTSVAMPPTAVPPTPAATARTPARPAPTTYSPLREVTESPLKPGDIEEFTKDLHSWERDLEWNEPSEVYEQAFYRFEDVVKAASYLDKKLKHWKTKYAKAKVRGERNAQRISASLTDAQQLNTTATTRQTELTTQNGTLKSEIEDLRKTIEWLSSSNEELRSINDDLRRENEDLREGDVDLED